MKRVVIESPYAGDVEKNLRYVQACMKDCLIRGEAPYASHALYTQAGVLDDTKPDERKIGMEAGFCWGDQAELTVIYTDLGCSSGMLAGIKRSIEAGRPFEERKLGVDWDIENWTREQEITELYKDLARYAEDGKMKEYALALKELRRLQQEEADEMRNSMAPLDPTQLEKGKQLIQSMVDKNPFQKVDEAYSQLREGHTDQVVVDGNSVKVVLNTDQKFGTQEEAFCRTVMGKIEEKLGSTLHITEILSYEDGGYSHFAIVMGDGFDHEQSLNLTWEMLREEFKDNSLNKTWLICLTLAEWTTYMDRDLYRWRLGL